MLNRERAKFVAIRIQRNMSQPSVERDLTHLGGRGVRAVDIGPTLLSLSTLGHLN